jgi:hypothetical protein
MARLPRTRACASKQTFHVKPLREKGAALSVSVLCYFPGCGRADDHPRSPRFKKEFFWPGAGGVPPKIAVAFRAWVPCHRELLRNPIGAGNRGDLTRCVPRIVPTAENSPPNCNLRGRRASENHPALRGPTEWSAPTEQSASTALPAPTVLTGLTAQPAPMASTMRPPPTGLPSAKRLQRATPS